MQRFTGLRAWSTPVKIPLYFQAHAHIRKRRRRVGRSQRAPVHCDAASAFDRVGLPEGRFPLSHAALYLATAPKSNSTMAFFDALAAVEKEHEEEIPNHLKDASRDSEGFGHGANYLYPHAFRDHWVAQQYLPSSRRDAYFTNPRIAAAKKR